MLNEDNTILTSMEKMNLETSQLLWKQNNKVNNYDGDYFNDIWDEDEASFCDAKDISSDAILLKMEWEKRHNEFHTLGYRDGITAGKEASAQEGFNDGFKKSVSAGYNWGLVRGISSVIPSLPEKLKEKLINNLEDKVGFQKVYESTQKISSKNALEIFYSSIEQNSSCNQLESLFKELNSLSNSAGISVDLRQKGSAVN